MSVKLLSTTHRRSPNKEICLYFNHPVTEIKVKNPPSEYCLVVCGHVSDNRSCDGVMKMADLCGDPIPAIARAAVGEQNKYLSPEQNKASINFSRLDRVVLRFDAPLQPNAQYDITASYFMPCDEEEKPLFIT